VAVEAASPFGWGEWLGLDGYTVAIDRFGVSAPGDQALEALGITAEAVASAAKGQIG
jgi:transketolase